MAHAAALEKLCRVCGKSVITKAKTKHVCTEHNNSLNQSFQLTPHRTVQQSTLSTSAILVRPCSTRLSQLTTSTILQCLLGSVSTDKVASVCASNLSLFRKVEDPRTYNTPLDALVTTALGTV